MKLESNVREIESSSVGYVKSFSIKANAKAFEILFGSIYPDIIKATVRELIANAWDSQKQANNLSKPIEIHVPNVWEPYFSVRDYGVSMTQEFIDTIYSSFFESTKTDSNDVVGAFGLGAKTPLGITDSFSVQCWLNGETRIYDIYLGENGNPMIALTYEGPDDGETGVLVSFGVKPEDFAKFKSYVELFAFGVPSEIKIDGAKYENKLIPLYSGMNWSLVSSNQIEGIHLRMGCILYKLNSAYTNAFYNYIRIPLILDFPIGTFKVTGSREDIIYNEETIKIISNKLKEVSFEISKDLEQKIADCKTFNHAYKKLKELAEVHQCKSLILNYNNIKWKSRKISSYNSKFRFSEKNGIYTKTFSLSSWKNNSITLSGESKHIYEYNRYFNTSISSIFIFVKPDTKHINRRLRTYINQGNSHNYANLIFTENVNAFSIKKMIVALDIKPNQILFLEDFEPIKIEKNKKDKVPLSFRYIDHNMEKFLLRLKNSMRQQVKDIMFSMMKIWM